MNNAVATMPAGVPIGVLEREIGLTRDTLRKWELRYGFPVPQRDRRGERVYPLEQVDQLRLIKRLLDRGMRPGKLVALDAASLRQLAQACVAPDAQPGHVGTFIADVLKTLQRHDPAALQGVLAQELMRIGLSEFVQVKLTHLHEVVGDAWAAGQIAVFQEHVYAEAVQTLLREAIARLPTNASGTTILLATPPGELHVLGILMVQAQCALAGVRCISLGAQMPVSELVAAAKAFEADVVGLSFSIAYPVRRIAPQLSELRRRLDPAVQLWAGGRGMDRVRKIPAGVHAQMTQAEVATALAAL